MKPEDEFLREVPGEGHDGGPDGVGVEVEVGDQSQGTGVWSHDQDALGLEVFRQACDLVSRDGGEDHVGLYGRDFDAFDVGEAIGEEAGVRVVVLQAINVVLEGVDAEIRQLRCVGVVEDAKNSAHGFRPSMSAQARIAKLFGLLPRAER